MWSRRAQEYEIKFSVITKLQKLWETCIEKVSANNRIMKGYFVAIERLAKLRQLKNDSFQSTEKIEQILSKIIFWTIPVIL